MGLRFRHVHFGKYCDLLVCRGCDLVCFDVQHTAFFLTNGHRFYDVSFIQTLTFEILVPIFTLRKSSWCGCHARTMLPLPSYSPSWLQPRPMRVLTSTFLMTRAMTIVDYFWRNVTKTLATMKEASKANSSGVSSCPPLKMFTFFLLRRWV